ncbi:MAG: 50S ribosomal protein L21e [Nanoarchaeota archaeon]|nr:50S ribosomal protein L21e [Nanoarchaeota archaeon]
MVKRKGSARRKTRQKLSKPLRRKGKISLTKYFRKFEKGQKVVIKPEPAYQKSIPHKRYFSKTAIITKKQGAYYEVALKIGNQPKKIIIHPVHLVKVK